MITVHDDYIQVTNNVVETIEIVEEKIDWSMVIRSATDILVGCCVGTLFCLAALPR